MEFSQTFDEYVCCYDTISVEIDGYEITARIEFDEDYKIDDDDCHNPDQSVTGCNDEQFDKLLAAREAWFRDEWFYCSVILSISKNGIELDDNAASLSGIECNYPDSDNSHLTEVANELLPEALEVGKNVLTELCA